MKSMRQFIIGGAVSIVICIGFFAWSTRDMVRHTGESVRMVGEIYLKEINNQVNLHFASIISLRLKQIEVILSRTLPEATGCGPRSGGTAADERACRPEGFFLSGPLRHGRICRRHPR